MFVLKVIGGWCEKMQLFLACRVGIGYKQQKMVAHGPVLAYLGEEKHLVHSGAIVILILKPRYLRHVLRTAVIMFALTGDKLVCDIIYCDAKWKRRGMYIG